MAMSSGTRRDLLSRWIKPSSDHEQAQQDRAERMVREAIAGSSAFSGSAVSIYTKGSYPNNTNVRQDSDVDVVVQLGDCFYYDFLEGQAPATNTITPYDGLWTPTSWRAAVAEALISKFGTAGVDQSGAIAINIPAVPGSRPSADVVPSFDYFRYDDPFRRVTHAGSCVFPRSGGAKVVNYPNQQLTNGRALNGATGGRYKNYVRALKNAENQLCAAGTIDDLASYFMECLVYNVPDDVLRSSDLDGGFQSTLVNLWQRLQDGSAYDGMAEPNELKWLFKGHNKWTVEDAKALVLATWQYLGYGE